MREQIEKVINESNPRPAGGARQECKSVPLEEKSKLEIQGKRRVLTPEPKDQIESKEADDKIHRIKMELSDLDNIYKDNPASDQAVQKKSSTFTERFMNGLKKLKEWFARRRDEKFTVPLLELQYKKVELIPILVQIKEAKTLPHYTLGRYKEGIAEKIITATEHIFKYISRVIKTVFSKLKGRSQLSETPQPVNNANPGI